jgi:glycosyltransferase involved in cell wall biosynthesis
MYNVGLALSRGEIVVICDSDAIATPCLAESILAEFDKNPNIVLHVDELRNNNKRFYPFNYPSVEEVLGEGFIDLRTGANLSDPYHYKNYGAGFCAKRADLIRIGGSDEHIDYLGRSAGPYEMTFRLCNEGKKEIWLEEEFLYHVWHPGVTEGDYVDYIGPNDGHGMSLTAMEILKSGRVEALVENKFITRLKNNIHETLNQELLIEPQHLSSWAKEKVSKHIQEIKREYAVGNPHLLGAFKGYNLVRYKDLFYAVPQNVGALDLRLEEARKHPEILTAKSKENLEALVCEKVVKQAIPVLVGAYRGFNLVEYGVVVYGLSQKIGALDLTQPTSRQQLPQFEKEGTCVAADSVENVHRLIDQAILAKKAKKAVQPHEANDL